jgi:hypothetical protein
LYIHAAFVVTASARLCTAEAQEQWAGSMEIDHGASPVEVRFLHGPHSEAPGELSLCKHYERLGVKWNPARKNRVHVLIDPWLSFNLGPWR